MFALNHQSSISLVQQIVQGFRDLVESGSLRAGTKLPSIRQFAHSHSISVYTVVDAYDRLVAQGYFISRPHSGFYVRKKTVEQPTAAPESYGPHTFDALWYTRRIFENRSLEMKPGCGWLPSDWLFSDGVRRGLRNLSAQELDIGGYGDPKGYPLLRQLIRDVLAEHELPIHHEQILLTNGSSHAMDLVARHLVHPGDKVLVDAPGYANLLASLRFMGAELLGVPRTPSGYDLEVLEQLLETHRPKVFFTQPRLQSPTGSCAHISHLHRVLQLAEKYDVSIVENDIYAALDTENRATLASLDQLRKVIYIGSFSKTITPNIRVGFLAGHSDFIEDIAQLKMISGLTSSEFSEQLVYQALLDGRWRKHTKTLRDRLSQAHHRVAEQLQALGFEIFSDTRAGMLMWVRHPHITDTSLLASAAAEQNILLGPGHLFAPDLKTSAWQRINVAHCDDPRIFTFLQNATT